MKILIIGASGLVGNNCMRHFKEQGEEVIAADLFVEIKDGLRLARHRIGIPIMDILTTSLGCGSNVAGKRKEMKEESALDGCKLKGTICCA